MEFAAKEKARFSVVTGGEPTMHRHTPRVVELLQASGFYVAVETNGTFAPNAPFDWITCSPKRDAEYKVHPEMISKVNEFKYVVDNDFDFAILDRHAPDSAQALSLSPEHGGFAVNTAKIIDYIKEHPQWRLSLQTHKIIGVP
jgi:organic radical activating enzyme